MKKIIHQIPYLELNPHLEEELNEEEVIDDQPYFEDTRQAENHQFLSSCCQKLAILQHDVYYCSECSETLDPELDLIDQSDEDRFLDDDYDEFTERMMSDLEDFN